MWACRYLRIFKGLGHSTHNGILKIFGKTHEFRLSELLGRRIFYHLIFLRSAILSTAPVVLDIS